MSREEEETEEIVWRDGGMISTKKMAGVNRPLQALVSHFVIAPTN